MKSIFKLGLKNRHHSLPFQTIHWTLISSFHLNSFTLPVVEGN